MNLIEVRCRILLHQDPQEHCSIRAWDIDDFLIVQRGVVDRRRPFETWLYIHVFGSTEKVVASLIAIDDSNFVDYIPKRIVNRVVPVAVFDLRNREDEVLRGQV